MRNIALAFIFLLSASFFGKSLQAGGVGGGVGMKPALLELLQVSRGASEISNDVYGVPNNYVLDARNRVVTFEANFEMSFDEIKENTEAGATLLEVESPAATESAAE